MPLDPESDETAPADPFADLLFTLIAAVLPAILVLLPALHLSGARPAAAPAAAAPAPEVRVRGARSWPIVAGAEGLRLTGAGDRLVPLDAVPDDAGLRAELTRLRGEGEPLLLIVEPAGLESAFLLEPVAALHGPREMVQVRAEAACGATRELALARACRAGQAPPASSTLPE